MQLTNVRTQYHHEFIPLQGWNNVEKAVRMYGKTAASTGSTKQFINEAPLTGGLSVLLAASSQQKDFAGNILAEARETIQDPSSHRMQQDFSLGDVPSWRTSFDYDALGTSFFKTEVIIALLDESAQRYALGFSAASIGTEAEVELAKALSVERGLKHADVIVEVPSYDSNSFCIDLNEIYRRLDPVIGSGKASPIIEAYNLACGGNEEIKIYNKKLGVIITISLNNVHHPVRYGKRRQYFWQSKKGIITGPLQKSFRDSDKFDIPKIKIIVRDTQSPVATFDSQRKTLLQNLTEQIALALSGQIVADRDDKDTFLVPGKDRFTRLIRWVNSFL